mgnify:CR=1 FL=1
MEMVALLNCPFKTLNAIKCTTNIRFFREKSTLYYALKRINHYQKLTSSADSFSFGEYQCSGITSTSISDIFITLLSAFSFFNESK